MIAVHADLSLSNLLLTEEGLVPIDFSLMGYSHPMMDIGCLYGIFQGGIHRRALTEGYVAAGRCFDADGADCLFAFNVFIGLVLHWNTWSVREGFTDYLSDQCERVYSPVARGEHAACLSACVVTACEEDTSAWLMLADLVADNFPGLELESYTATLQKNIARKTALCVKEDGKIVGVLLFSPNLRTLSCMAVHPEYRRYGIASALIREMLLRMPEGDITVTTFREGDPLGDAPRALYQKFGFRPGELTQEFGHPTQVFTLRRPAG